MQNPGKAFRDLLRTELLLASLLLMQNGPRPLVGSESLLEQLVAQIAHGGR